MLSKSFGASAVLFSGLDGKELIPRIRFSAIYPQYPYKDILNKSSAVYGYHRSPPDMARFNKQINGCYSRHIRIQQYLSRSMGRERR